MKRLVIGMIAHVDSGKTTLSEAMLYLSGNIRKQGRVDHGDAFLDTHHIERDRGITVFSKQAVMRCGGNEYTLLDTPGHADLSSETERALCALDYAVMVISGSEGVQEHTVTLWHLLTKYDIPTFVFINKMDISPFDRSFLMETLSGKLNGRFVDFTPVRDTAEFFEEAALCDEKLMDHFLESDTIPDEDISQAIKERKIFPCYFGSALRSKGVTEFIEGLEKYTLQTVTDGSFAARIFKITEEQGVRLTHMKINSGSLKVRSMINGEKINRIRVYSGAKFICPEEVFAGTLCAAEGLSDTHAGQGLGADKGAPQPFLEPVMTYRLIPPEGTDEHTFLAQMRILEAEDPQLHIMWNDRLREIHVSLMGDIQLEILRALIKERFGIEAGFGKGSILYKETVASPVCGAGHYEPLRHYAEVRLRIEPAERGSGVTFLSECSEDVLSRNWQRLILSELEGKTHIGVLTGSPVTDVKIILTAGRAHLKHTEGGDFRQAAWRAVRQGLRKAENILLEPWYEFTIEIPSDSVGRAISDIQRMCGEFSAPETNGDTAVIKGSVPASEIAGYHSELMGYSHGRGKLTCVPKGYFPCHDPEQVIEEAGYRCDEDIENTADSVFCSHGAGYIVRWDEADSHMHTADPSAKDRSAEEGYSSAYLRRQAQDYRSRLAEDKELMEIFERTYGKIDRDPRYALHTKKDIPEKKQKPVPMQNGKEYVLVDGYNVIFAWDDLKALASENLDAARSRLTNILCNYQGFRQCELILVFDAYKVRGNDREVEKFHNISVVYTKEAETADMYIEKVSHELSKEYRVRVVTSDGAEQIIILGNGAFRVSAEEFRREVAAVEKAIREFIDKS